ncbi:MAG TPA: hypothetical protein V6D06_06835, partial [Trichocoleus sp.]
QPEQSSLLSVSPSALLTAYLTETSGNIQNQGQLLAGQTLSLVANRLDLKGQLAAGEDLILLAGDTVQIRDAVEAPFVALAGGDLLVQGNEQVDIVTLSHPDSELYAYGDMTLRSANAVGGDARYWSGGTFRVEALDGSPGSLHSPVDPIIRTVNDVVIERYRGTSLHILAGGSVTLGTAVITGPAAGQPGVDYLQETVVLSDGTAVQANGAAQPTLDVRAGVRPQALGTPSATVLTGFDQARDRFVGKAFVAETASSADITVGDVFINAPNGLVLLTNQYSPNADIPGGSIFVTGEGIYGDGINTRGFGRQGGTVFLEARDDISVTNSFIKTSGPGQVGDIVLVAGGTVRFDGLDGSPTGASSDIATGERGIGGDVQIRANNLEVINGAQLSAATFGQGPAGSVILEITDTARFVGSGPDSKLPSGAFSRVTPIGQGAGGDVRVKAVNLEVLDGAVISTATFGEGDAGSVILEIAGTARFAGYDVKDGSNSGAFSDIAPNGKGNGGNVEIRAANLEVLSGAQLGAGTAGEGIAGNVTLEISDTALFEGFNPIRNTPSGAFSSIGATGKGDGGDLKIRATNLRVLNGAILSAATSGEGNAGNVLLDVADTASFEGVNSIKGNPSGAYSSVVFGSKGAGGDLKIAANTLEVLSGAALSAGTAGKGDSGDVILEITGVARLDSANAAGGSTSMVTSSVGLTGWGNGGDLKIRAGTLEVLNGSQLNAATSGQGDAGTVVLEITGVARFDGVNPVDRSQGGAFSSVQPQGKGSGGDLKIRANTLEVLNGALLVAGTFGDGDSGNVILEIADAVRFADFKGAPSGALTSVGSSAKGQGGDIRIQAARLDISSGGGLTAGSVGQGDAGNVVLSIRDRIQSNNGIIATNARSNSGGQIQIETDSIFLLGDSDIQTFVNSGENSGGNITINANFLIALDDSDLLAFAVDGRGGNIDLTRTAFFGQNFQIATLGTDPSTLDDNSRVDISATGRLASGSVSLPDVSFIENSLTELADTLVGTETFTAGSCIASSSAEGAFVVSGQDGLPSRPGDAALAAFATGSVQVLDGSSAGNKGEQALILQEPEGLYQLADGRLVLSRACQD